jgi:hypothetical protein
MAEIAQQMQRTKSAVRTRALKLKIAIAHEENPMQKGRRAAQMRFLGILALGAAVASCEVSQASAAIVRNCKLDVAATAGLSVDQSLKSCINDEQKARRQLGSQWSKFPAASRASCTSQESIGGTPSYVSLQTCLEMN